MTFWISSQNFVIHSFLLDLIAFNESSSPITRTNYQNLKILKTTKKSCKSRLFSFFKDLLFFAKCKIWVKKWVK